jgi:hypothetical protein
MKIIIAIVCTICVIFTSGCISQPTQCPESCNDGDDCTNDYCSSVTEYECKNDIISPCCGNNICDIEEDYITCVRDCDEPIDIGELEASARIYDQGDHWTIFRREVYEPPPSGISSSVIKIPLTIKENIDKIQATSECSYDNESINHFVNFNCKHPENCHLAKSNLNSLNKDIVKDLEKGDTVDANFLIYALFDDNTYFFDCRVNIFGKNPIQNESIDLSFTYSNYVE